MLINYDDEVDKIIKIRKGKIQEGYKLDLPEIDEYFRFKKGNFNLILGHANTGKTTITLFLMLLYVSIEGIDVIKCIGIFSNDALDMAISLAL